MLCLIVVPLPSGETPFAVKINSKKNGPDIETVSNASEFLGDTLLSTKRGYDNGKLSPVVGNVFMKHSEKTERDTADHKPVKWLRYVDIFVANNI
jgi:hypothetical protein